MGTPFKAPSLAACCAALTACASEPRDPNVVRATAACEQDVSCFYERNIRSFRVLDDRTVIVLVGRDRCPFKLELDGFFCDVNTASFLAFDDSDGRICRWDRTVVAPGPFAREREYCRVADVTPMSDDELLEAYAMSGLTPPLPARGSGELEVVEETPEAEAPAQPDIAADDATDAATSGPES